MKNLLFSAFFLGVLFFMRSDAPRGIRNNNPLNIKHNPANDWRGQVGNDGVFVVFDDAIHGIRAGARLLANYQRLYGLDTIAQIITRFAPPTENNTEAYINHVASKLGLSSNAIVDASDYVNMLEVMILHENGVQPYSRELIAEGVALA